MTRYHLKDDGNPGVCKAEEGKCPKGGEHFDNEQDARQAVERLFGGSFEGGIKKATAEPSLAVYTKTAVKDQFGDLISAKSGYSTWESRNNTAYMTSSSSLVSDVRRILLDHRLDVKAQNAKAREAIAEAVSKEMDLRLNGTKEERLSASVGMHYTMDVLTSHYDWQDPRSKAQIKADAAYVKGLDSEGNGLGDTANWGANAVYGLSKSSNEELKAISTLSKKISGGNYTEEDLEKMQALNPQARIPVKEWSDDEALTPLDRYRTAKILLKDYEQVPESVRQYLPEKVQPDRLKKEIESSVLRINSISPQYGNSNSLMTDDARVLHEVALRTARIRKSNQNLESAVLNAK